MRTGGNASFGVAAEMEFLVSRKSLCAFVKGDLRAVAEDAQAETPAFDALQHRRTHLLGNGVPRRKGGGAMIAFFPEIYPDELANTIRIGSNLTCLRANARPGRASLSIGLKEMRRRQKQL